MVSVDICELLPQDSGDDKSAAVNIRPRRPTSQDKLVSVTLEVIKKQVSHVSLPVSASQTASQQPQ